MDEEQILNFFGKTMYWVGWEKKCFQEIFLQQNPGAFAPPPTRLPLSIHVNAKTRHQIEKNDEQY